ncbi:MAG: hydrolase TatD [Desulfococcus sp. 4484_241]|nr:MAG: hydrolase TatD [Desulfococcus sp. 4484_241]RLC29400.1 MAG: TatD family deoxyribonuclease [Deltaproteobacteria bacterium]
MPRLFDSHCHLDDRCYAGHVEDVLARARSAGVAACMVVGVTVASSERAARIADLNRDVYSSVGIHPHDVGRCDENTIEVLRVIAENHPKVRAWGEVGLDFNRMYSPRHEQEKWFERQVAEARSLGLPLIFHERDSGGRFLEMLKACFPGCRGGVVHCFSGTRDELRAYLDLGLYIGITGVITIKSRGENLRELVHYIPDDRILIETDAPYLTPAPERNRAKRNEPAFVRSVFKKLAQVKKSDPDTLAVQLWENTCRLFDIHP